MDLAYDHVQAIVPSLRPLDDYLRLQSALDEFRAGTASWPAAAAAHGVEDMSKDSYSAARKPNAAPRRASSAAPLEARRGTTPLRREARLRRG